jgi:hypothetical protein
MGSDAHGEGPVRVQAARGPAEEGKALDPSDLSADQLLWIAAAALLALAMLATFAEHRRGRRRNLDRVGIMPWNLIQIIAFLAAIAAAGIALKR